MAVPVWVSMSRAFKRRAYKRPFTAAGGGGGGGSTFFFAGGELALENVFWYVTVFHPRSDGNKCSARGGKNPAEVES